MPVGNLRAALLASAALTALCLPPAQPARAGPDPCNFSDGEQALICSGDQSGGINEVYQYSVIVRDLTREAGSITLFGRDSISLETEPGPYGIIAYGEWWRGISVVTTESAHVENNLRITMPNSWYGTGIDVAVLVGTESAEVINRGDVTMLNGFFLQGIIAGFGDGGGIARVENHGAVTLEGDFSRGIQAGSNNGVASITNDGRITITGDRTIGLRARTYSGVSLASIVNSGDVTLTGANATGIFAFGTNDSRVDNKGAIMMTGPGGRAIVARGYNATIQNDGRLTLNSPNSFGIDASVFGAVLVTNTGDITTTARGNIGISAFSTSQGKASIVNSGDIAMSGGASRGLWASAANGDVYVKNSGVVTLYGPGESLGIGAFASLGQVTVDNDGALNVAGGHAIDATNFIGDIVITNDASLTAGRDGIYARVFTDGRATITNSGEISGGTGGIRVQTTGGDATIINTGHVSSSGYTGIEATVTNGAATIHNSGNISIGESASGQPSAAIMATIDGGDIGIKNDNALQTGAGGIGISATANLRGNITIDSDSARADGSGGIIADVAGIQAIANTGDVSVVSVGEVTAGIVGIEAYSRYGGNISVKSYGTILANAGSAIIAVAGGSGSVTIRNTGDITARQDGLIGVTRNGDVTIVSAGAITVDGDVARAIHLEAYGQGIASINSVGLLSAAGRYSRGIAAKVRDGVAITADNQGDVQSAGYGAHGISLESARGDIGLTSRGAITAEGGFNYGIAVRSGGADAAVVSEGDIRILGQFGRGIVAKGVHARVESIGNVALDGNGAIGILADASVASAAGDPGIARIASAGAVTMTGTDAVALEAKSLFGDAEIIVADGTVSGGSGPGGAGIELSGARAVRLENRGVIQSLNDRAIVNLSGSGPATIDNLNRIIGTVSLDDGEDRLDNRGLFEARDNSDFGSGVDAMVNAGVLRVSDSGGADQVTILGLESFTNGATGLITMVDGRAGDRLTLPALTAFNGGGTVALDVALAGTGAPADLLTVSGVVSGTTLVAVNNVVSSIGVRGADDIFVIDQGSRPRGDEFRLSGGPISAGFLYYDLRPDDDGSTRWELYEAGTNWQGIDALGAVMTGLQNVWHAGVGAWHQRMADLVSPSMPRPSGGAWLRGFGENADYEPPDAAAFHQSIAASQGGADGIARGPLGGDSVIAGLLGAYVDSDLDLDRMPDRVGYKGGSIGGYLAYLNGGFHADLLVKADLLTVTYQQRALSEDFDAKSLGGSFELGCEFDIGDGFYLGPLAQLAYVASDIDDGRLADTVPMSFDDGDSLRSRTGLRAGYRAAVAGAVIEPYLDAHFLHEFAGDNRGIVYGYFGASNELDSWGTVGGGVRATAASFTAFATLQSFVGDEIGGIAGQGGLRWSF